MKKLTPSFIAATVCLTLNASDSFANNTKNEAPENLCSQQCLVDAPVFDRPLVDGDVNKLPVNISSDQFETSLPDKAIYQGNVSITQGNREVSSQKVILSQSQKTNRNIVLNGDVVYQDNLIQMHGDNASINLDTHDIKIDNSQYHLVGRLGRGTAQDMEFTDNRYIIIHDGSFTSCPVNDSSWNIEGSTIIHDNDEQLLEVWNAVFKIGKVPVLYSPYLQLPTGNKRRSGLLMPNFSYDSVDGIDFSLPFYWNIAPNYDATFTPRLIQRRGVQLKTEMRYLNELGLGTFAFDWLQHDRLYSHDKKSSTNARNNGYSDNNYRWLFYWKNEELINYNWRLSVDATRVSDNQYLTDLGSSYASETDGYLSQFYQIGYSDEKWDANLSYRYFQPLFTSLKNDLYRTEPQLNINYYDSIGNFNITTFGQVSHFVTSGNKNPKTWRYHFQPTIDYTIMSPWASISTEASFLATHYNQDVPNSNTQQAYLKKNVDRFLPKFSVDAKMIFERDVDSLEGYSQTLEPRVKYLYIPYRNQSRIGNYDSSLLQSDYIGLFREQPYSGLDRIASANKVATGITTRFYDENKSERFNLSLGQIYYFTRSRTGDSNSALDQAKDTGSITWATDANWYINNEMIVRSGLQYDTRINEVSLANAIFEYRKSDQKMVQFSYRYANKNYIDSIGVITSNTPYQKQDISQLGFVGSWPLTDTLSAVAAYYYDIDNHQTADNFVGLHYADCCWGVSLQYGRKIVDWDSYSEKSKYENKFSMNFELRGLTKNNNAIAKMLNFGLLPYKTAFEENYGTN